jgi:hypothetical protein
MSQKNTLKILNILLIQVLFLVVMSSCSKSPSGVRPQIKNQQTVLNPQQSTAAQQAAASVNANYKIETISLPRVDGARLAIDVELASPSGQYLPVTTYHSGSATDSSGIYNDTQRGVQVRLEARCSNTSDCEKYMLLITVLKDSQVVFQQFAISYLSDCRFNVASTSAGNGSYYQDISAAEVAFSNVRPVGDIDTCPQ